MTDVDAKRDPGVRAIRAIAALGAAAAILVLWPGTHSPPQDPKYFLIGILPLFLGVAWLVDRLRRKHDVIATGLPFYLLAGFLLLQFIAALFSLRTQISLAAFAPFLALGLIAFLVAQGVRTAKHAWTLLCWIAVAVALSSVYGLAQKAGWDPFPWATRDIEEYRGLPSTYGNPNIATHCLNLGLLILVGLSFRQSTRWCAVLLLPIALHLYFTEVRAARVAVLAGVGIVILAGTIRRFGTPPRGAMLWTCLTAALVALALGSAAMIYTKWSTGTYLPTGHSLLLRYNGYYGASQMIADRPLLGFGPGTFRIENVPYWTPYEETTFATDARYNAHVHNAYLESGVEAGFGGAFFYIGFIVSLILVSLGTALATAHRDLRMLAFTLAACFTAFAVDGLFGFNLRSPASALILFILAGILVGTTFKKGSNHTGPSSRMAATPFACVAVSLLLAVVAGAEFASQIFRQKATAANTQGYPQQALVFLGRAMQITPWDADIVRQTAEVHATTGRTRDAIDVYQEALRLNPYWVMDHLNLARQYFQLSESGNESFLRQATESAERALALCATLPGAHELLGRIALAQALDSAGNGQEPEEKSVREAIDHFQKALQYGVSDREQVHRMTAEAHLILGQNDEAERAYQRAAELTSGTDMTWALFEQFAQETGRWTAFTDALNNAMDRIERVDPGNCTELARIAWWLSQAYAEGLNDRALASQVLESGVRSCPQAINLWGAYVKLHDAAHDRVRLKAAMNRLDHVTEANSGTPKLVSDLVTYLNAPDWNVMQQIVDFLDDLPEAVKESTTEDPARAYGWLFSVYGSDLATSIGPPEARADLLVRLGRVAAELGAYVQANEILVSALPLLPKGPDVDCQLLRVAVLECMGRYDEAQKVAADAAKRAPNDYRTQHALARQSALSGRTAEARLAYRLLLTRFMLDPQTRSAVEQEMKSLMGDGQ